MNVDTLNKTSKENLDFIQEITFKNSQIEQQLKMKVEKLKGN